MEGQLIGRYRIVRRLGEGGMGMVFEAVREDIGGRAAVKVLRPELAQNAEIATRFFNEARAANLVEHTGIVRVFDYGSLPSGVAYLAMEYLEGESLGARIKRQGRMSIDEAVCLGRQITGALAAAHAKKVIHRDLKPANVMIIPCEEAASGETIKIVDFGIAKLTQDGQNIHTRTGSLMGTPIYMSPEQCRGAVTVDEKSDVYSFGIMFYEMLVGRPPFVAEGQGDLIAMHMFAPPPPLAGALPGASPELLSLMERILAKDPAARPSMALVATELQRLSSRSTGAKPAIAVQQTVRTVAPVAYATTTPPPTTGGPASFAATTPPPVTALPVSFASTPPPPVSLPPSYTANSFEMQSNRAGGSRNRTAVRAALVVLLIGAGGAAYRFLLPGGPNAEADAAKQLAAIDTDLTNKRWTEAAVKASRILDTPELAAPTRDSARARRDQADKENHALQTYNRILGSGDDYDQIVQLYPKIPKDSIYQASARDSYDKVFPLFVEKHLRDAADARERGSCQNFRSEVQAVLDADPKQVKALAVKDLPCTLPKGSAAQADEALSNAQTEYVNGNFQQAIDIATSVQRESPVRAWRIIGASACSLKNLKVANESFKHLDAASRQYLVYTCQRHNIINTGSKFKLSEP